MAVNPFFTFADPQLQAAVVQEAQVAAAARAAQAQQRAATLAALRQERQAASDREERRAIREADIRRLDANEAERRRQFDASLGLSREDIASREKIAGATTGKADDRELFSNLLKLAESDDPPTLKELEARMVDLSEPRKQALRDRRNATATSKLRNFNSSRAEAQRLAGLIGKPDGKGGTYTADSVLRGSQWKTVLQVTPDGLGFESLLTPPREDTVAAAPRVDDGFRFYNHPGVRATESIGDIERRSPRAGTPGFAYGFGVPPQAVRPAGPGVGFAGGLNRFFVPAAEPVAPPMRPPPAMLGNQGVLAPLDYSGPEFDYGRPRFAVPEQFEDPLAPPVFVPQY